MQSKNVPSRKHSHPTRGRHKQKRDSRRARRNYSYDEDEETGNDALSRYSSSTSDSESEREDGFVPIGHRQPKTQTRWFCFCCNKRRAKCFHQTIRDVAIVVMLIVFTISTMKDSQRQAVTDLYNQLTNFTGVLVEQVQYLSQRGHNKQMRTTHSGPNAD